MQSLNSVETEAPIILQVINAEEPLLALPMV